MVVICSHQSQNRLADLVAEHLDHLHYLNDILSLDIGDLNQVLTDHLLNKLLIPLYVYSLTKRRRHSQLEVMGFCHIYGSKQRTYFLILCLSDRASS